MQDSGCNTAALSNRAKQKLRPDGLVQGGKGKRNNRNTRLHTHTDARTHAHEQGRMDEQRGFFVLGQECIHTVSSG